MMGSSGGRVNLRRQSGCHLLGRERQLHAGYFNRRDLRHAVLLDESPVTAARLLLLIVVIFVAIAAYEVYVGNWLSFR
jgi:hypothetical protein